MRVNSLNTTCIFEEGMSDTKYYYTTKTPYYVEHYVAIKRDRGKVVDPVVTYGSTWQPLTDSDRLMLKSTFYQIPDLCLILKGKTP